MDISKIKDHFPLVSFESVISLFKSQLESKEKDPNISILSICLGFIENVLCKEQQQQTFPVLEFETVETLYKKFKSLVAIAETSLQQPPAQKSRKSQKDESQEPKIATREKIKKISDVIWHSLLRSSYKVWNVHVHFLIPQTTDEILGHSDHQISVKIKFGEMFEMFGIVHHLNF